MYRFAITPRWILSHLFVLFVVVVFVNLGLWQLRRHDDRAARNATVVARTEQPAVPVGELLDADPDLVRFRTVEVAGRWAAERDLLVDNRSSGGLPGVWVLRPVETASGEVVVVNRGFAGYVGGELPDLDVADETVALVGRIETWRGSCGTRTDDAGVVVGTACLNPDAAAAAFSVDDATLAPFVVQAQAASPPEAALDAVPAPPLDAGPHRSYAGQWFLFTAIVAGVYVLILRKVARERAGLRIGAPEPAEPLVHD